GDGVQTDIPLRFPGQIADIHSSLNYNYFRDYDPETGRYVESDPIGLKGGLNTYGYVVANPIKYFDPYGLDTITVGGSVRIIGLGWFFEHEAPPQGISCGIALSYPGFFDG